ncbi:MAG: carbohydrate ABC transporter permease [Lachnospiraceae bacterium]|jgi:raffinose/stachyose/melibiose transport system permease protein|nr:carbohydrate ABC transporter permease [Lachnospiraceae bacterium]MCI1398283.1 carbohydrate ABC transporter permease [Lachnospiraceae bacterium]MCI1424537.1 carbohydrate ABC transporter permease [Lachnospiraceae bacterium]
MIHNTRYKVLKALRITILWLVAIISLAPFYVAICYAFKSKQEFAKTKLAFPTSIYLQNFVDAFKLKNYFSAIINSSIVAVSVVILIIICCSASAYMITRKNNKFYNFVYYFFQMVILIPFQTIMFPLYQELSRAHALNTLFGVIFAELGVYMGYYVFLYAGFIKTVPVALEEAASIDGANRYQVFMKIVLPLLKPITMTVGVLCFLSSWNDFFLPLILIQKDEMKTLPLMQFFFFGQYSANINLAFAASLIALVPPVIIYFCAQKYIVAGMVAGAVKS